MFKVFSKRVKVTPIWSAGAIILLISLGFSGASNAQNADKSKNNPYSPSPSRKMKPSDNSNAVTSSKPIPGDVSFITHQAKNLPVIEAPPTISKASIKNTKNADLSTKPPTEIYKVGVGDMLFVNLKNSPRGSGYFTVRADGTIDFPLAGESVSVAGQTTGMVEEFLASAITLFPNPQLEVKVRQYSSHRITVSGLVDDPGEKHLQREAMPLFAIRAEAGVNARAVRALVTRAPLLKAESYDLREVKTDDVLIYPGNSVEFVGDPVPTESYFVIGKGVTTGQKPLTPGITLYQAAIASAGPKGEPKKAILRRKNASGIFMHSEYNLRSIREGKYMDPILTSGDFIEIR